MDIRNLEIILKDFNYWQKAMEYADINYKMEAGDSIDKYNKGIEIKEAYESGYKLALKIVSDVIAHSQMIDNIHAENLKLKKYVKCINIEDPWTYLHLHRVYEDLTDSKKSEKRYSNIKDSVIIETIPGRIEALDKSLFIDCSEEDFLNQDLTQFNNALSLMLINGCGIPKGYALNTIDNTWTKIK